MPDDLVAALDSERQFGSGDPFVPQSDEDSSLAQRIERDISRAMSRVNAQRAESLSSHKAYDGHQWDELDKMRLENLRRPVITFNEIKPTINAISGIERMNRADIRYVARSLTSSPVEDASGDLATEARMAALDLCDGEIEFSRAVKDMGIGGIGWFECRMDYSVDPSGRYMIERLPWDELIWDTHALKENLSDRKWCARKREFTREQFRKRWPQMVGLIDLGPPDYDEMNVGKYELVTPYYSLANENANPQVGTQGPLANRLAVIQYQWLETVPYQRFVDPTRQDGSEFGELPEDEWRKLVKRMILFSVQPPMSVRVMKGVYKQAFVCRGIVLKDANGNKVQDLPSGFSLKCLTGEYDHDKKVWYGIVRPMLDPQRTMNKAMSSALTFLVSNAKGGVMFESDAFTDPEMAKAQWSRPDAWIELQPGGAAKVVQREASEMPNTIPMFFQEAKAAMTYVSGVTEEMIGIAQGEISSTTASKRVQSGLAVLGWFFDNVAKARKDEARTTLEFIREFWTQGQLIRVGGSFNAKAVPLLKSSLPLEYDLMLDESVRHNPNLKAQIWQDLQPMIPALLRFGFGRFLIKCLRFSSWPAQLVNELEQEAQQMAQDPQQQQRGRGKQVDPRETDAKVEKMTAEADLARAEARAIDAQQPMRVAELALDTWFKSRQTDAGERQQQHKALNETLKVIKTFMGNAPEPQDDGTPPSVP